MNIISEFYIYTNFVIILQWIVKYKTILFPLLWFLIENNSCEKNEAPNNLFLWKITKSLKSSCIYTLAYVNFLFPHNVLVMNGAILVRSIHRFHRFHSVSSIVSIPLSTTSRALFTMVKRAAFSPSLQTIKGRNYFKRLLRGSGAVADYYVSPTTAPLFSPLMRVIMPGMQALFTRLSNAFLFDLKNLHVNVLIKKIIW